MINRRLNLYLIVRSDERLPLPSETTSKAVSRMAPFFMHSCNDGFVRSGKEEHCQHLITRVFAFSSYLVNYS